MEEQSTRPAPKEAQNDREAENRARTRRHAHQRSKRMRAPVPCLPPHPTPPPRRPRHQPPARRNQGYIRFWNTVNNTALSCVDTGSQALRWGSCAVFLSIFRWNEATKAGLPLWRSDAFGASYALTYVAQMTTDHITDWIPRIELPGYKKSNA